MNPEIEQLKAQVASLQQQINQLKSFNTIPRDIESAFATRLTNNLQEKVLDITDDFPANPLSKQVSEGGMSTYYVMDQPDYALKLRLRNSYVAIPAFDY